MSKKQGYTIVTLPVAIVKRPKSIYYLTVFESRSADVFGRSSTYRTHGLTKINLARLAPTIVKANERLVDLALQGEPVDKLADRLLINLEQVRSRRDGAAEVAEVSGSKLDALLGLGKQVATTGKIGQYADDEDFDAVTTIGRAGRGAGLVAGSAGTAALIGSTSAAGVEIGVGAFVAGATASGFALAGGAVLAAFAGGYLIGTAINEGAWALAGWIGGEDDAADPLSVIAPDAGDGGSGDGGSGDGGSDDGGSGDGDSDDGDSDDGDSDDGDSGDGGSGDGGSGDGDSDDGDSDGDGGTAAGPDSTPTPDDDATAHGALALFLATGLGAQQVEQQRRAIEVMRGGAIGAPDRDTGSIFDLSPHLAAPYLKLITRQIEAKRNKYGAVVQSYSTGPINFGALPNFGLVDPGPIDVIFFGQTTSTFNIARRIR